MGSKLLLTLFLWLVVACGLFAAGPEDAVFRRFSQADGLSQNSVFSVAQDGDGFMWFATRDGLNKYDGYNFTAYRHEDKNENSLVGNDIRALHFDSTRNVLWIGTLEGLSRLDLVTNRFYNYRAGSGGGLSSDNIMAVYEDRSGRIWVGTRAGLNLYDPSADRFSKINVAAGNGEPVVHSLAEDGQGTLWMGTADGLALVGADEAGKLQVVSGEQVTQTFPGAPAGEEVHIVFFDRSGKFWMGTESEGLFCWRETGKQPQNFRHNRSDASSLSHNTVKTITQGPQGELWVGTFVGLNRLAPEGGSFRQFLHDDRNQASLSNNSVREVFFDRQGGLWTGTYHGGVNYYHPNLAHFRQYRQNASPASISSNVVSAIVGAEGNCFWVGTEGGGLNYFDYGANTFRAYRNQENDTNSLSGNHVKSLLWDGKGLWVGTFGAGLNYFDPDSGSWRRYRYREGGERGLSHNNVYDLLLDNNELWILTFGAGLDVLDLDTGAFRNFSSESTDTTSLSSNQGRTLLRDGQGRLWVGTQNGLNLLTGSSTAVAFKRLLPGRQIYALTEAADGRIWAGTLNDGLFVLDPADFSWRQFTAADGLPGHTIYGILQDEQGLLWLSTNIGIVSFNPENMHATAFSVAAGLQNLEYNFNGYHKAKSGELFFGGLQGLTVFSPENFRTDSTPPTLVFTELRRANRRVPVTKDGLLKQALNYTEDLVFDYNTANFSIGFALTDYLDPANSQYAYRLEGLEPEWTYSRGKTEATYTIQRSGDYVFRLKGANENGIWSSNERTIRIEVLPPPWRSGWACLAYSLLLFGAGYALFRFIRLRHRLELERVEKVRQEDAHESRLRFFTNITHEFRTPLTLILGPLEDLLQKYRDSADYERMVGIERNMKRLLNLVNQILIFRKLEADHTPLNAVRADIVVLLEGIYVSFRETARLKGIDFVWEVEPDSLFFAFDQDKLDKVFFNLLSNAFTFTPRGGKIVLSASLVHEQFEVRVKNSGRGIAPGNIENIFERFYEDRSTAEGTTGRGAGIGLALSRQLVELHQGMIRVQSEPGLGTCFTVRLPLDQAALTAFTTSRNQGVSGQAMITSASKVDEDLSEVNVPDALAKESVAGPLLLIVEDNPEVSTYLESIFQHRYRVVSAPDGAEGLKQTRLLQPDVVISDVMMPEMDGETMCRLIKEDINTSHIPVILLTARAIEHFRIGGLRAGADDYLTKPFNPEELRLRVENTLLTRRRFRESFGKGMTLNPGPVEVTTLDEAFLQRALDIAEQNIGNADFRVEEYARQLAVSRALLFTKFKSLTGKTPNKFLRGLRLKRAAQLLTDSDFQVSQIADLVGFRDVRYFSKCFQQSFDLTPTEFRNKGK